jgi:hypothetical protein
MLLGRFAAGANWCGTFFLELWAETYRLSNRFRRDIPWQFPLDILKVILSKLKPLMTHLLTIDSCGLLRVHPQSQTWEAVIKIASIMSDHTLPVISYQIFFLPHF